MLSLSLSTRRCAHAKGEPRIVIVFANRSFSSCPRLIVKNSTP